MPPDADVVPPAVEAVPPLAGVPALPLLPATVPGASEAAGFSVPLHPTTPASTMNKPHALSDERRHFRPD
jgi:hypothetical protein